MDDGVDSYLDAVDASYDPTGVSGDGSGSGNGGSSGNGVGNFFQYLNQAATTAGNVYGTLNHPLKPNTTARNAAATQSTLMKWLPYAIGGVVLIVVLAMFTGGRR